MTSTVISIDDIRDCNVDTAKLVNNGRSGVKINASIIIDFDILEIFKGMNGLVDAIKTSMSEFIFLSVHGERDIIVTRSV